MRRTRDECLAMHKKIGRTCESKNRAVQLGVNRYVDYRSQREDVPTRVALRLRGDCVGKQHGRQDQRSYQRVRIRRPELIEHERIACG